LNFSTVASELQSEVYQINVEGIGASGAPENGRDDDYGRDRPL
jgi:hypothetical protein